VTIVASVDRALGFFQEVPKKKKKKNQKNKNKNSKTI